MPSIYCSLSLSPRRTPRNANMHIWVYVRAIINLTAFLNFCLQPLISSCSPLRKQKIARASALAFPELTKEPACVFSFNKADSHQSLQLSKPNPFTPNLQQWTRAFPHPHSLFSLNGHPATFLHSRWIGRPFCGFLKKTNGSAWKRKAQARIAPNVNLNGAGEFGPERLWHVYWQNGLE